MVPKRIAVVTLSVGSGHVRAGEIIQRVLQDGAENIQVRSLDVLELARPWFLALYVQSYWLMLRHAPWMWRWLFERRQKRRHRSTAPAWMFRRGCAEVLQQLKSFSPHLVIAAEIGAAEIAALGKREAWFSAPILAVSTDFHAEPPWVQREIDVYCVGSDEAKSQLIEWGVSQNRIFISGIPIDPSFALPFDKDDLLKALGLDAHRPVVLLMGGGMGPAPLDDIVRELERCRLPLQVLAVAGHDQALRQRLDALRGHVALDLHCFGWSDNVPELMAASSLLITKPGGVTTAEALAAGLPMILTHPIPGPEERHVQYLGQRGVAAHAFSVAEIPQRVYELLSNATKLEEVRRRARELARADAVYTIAQVGRALLEKATTIELLSSPPTRAGESAYLM